jgi:hypothetical protein
VRIRGWTYYRLRKDVKDDDGEGKVAEGASVVVKYV